MPILLGGLRSGFSLFRTNPASAIAAALALSLGIGFSTTMFSIVRGGTRALPFEEPDSIIAVERLAAGPGTVPVSSLRDYQLWARTSRSFDALGAFQSQSLNIGGDGSVPERVPAAAVTPGTFELTIVGVVSDLMSGDVDQLRQDGIYASIHQMRPYAVRVIAKGPSDPRALLTPLREAVARVSQDLPILETLTAREAAMRDKQVLAVLSRLFGIFGGGALLITAIGLYSVTAFSVAQRRREMGIRLALGATRGSLVGLLAKQVARQLAIGLSAGVLLAYALIRGFSAAVEFNGGNQPAVLVAVALSLLITAMAATAGPALTASGTDPVRSLRE
jgi:hypothetical protein